MNKNDNSFDSSFIDEWIYCTWASSRPTESAKRTFFFVIPAEFIRLRSRVVFVFGLVWFETTVRVGETGDGSGERVIGDDEGGEWYLSGSIFNDSLDK